MWSWTIRKAECQRNDAFKLWCWRRLLRVPWTARRSNQSILKEINSEYSLERLLLKVQYFGYLMQRANSLEKTWCWERLKAEGEGDNRGWGGWMASLTQWTWVWARSGRWWRMGKSGMLQSMGSQRVGHNWATEQQCTSARRPIYASWESQKEKSEKEAESLFDEIMVKNSPNLRNKMDIQTQEI